MTRLTKTIVLALLGIAMVVIFTKPNLGFMGLGEKYKTFRTTPNATVALDNSIKKGHPVFLEFYAKW
ncbi:MAG: hypothetical protein ACYC21_01600 [Eubacteriales bacterium]